MAQTQYTLLIRYLNEKTNTLIQNPIEDKYQEVYEFYCNDHKIKKGTEQEQIDAQNEYQDIILNAAVSTNKKNGMLFMYDGTRRCNHLEWIREQNGFVVHDWSTIESEIDMESYAGKYVLIGGTDPRIADVVSKTNLLTEKKVVIKDETMADQSGSVSGYKYYSLERIHEIMQKNTMMEVKELDDGMIGSYLTPVSQYWDTPGDSNGSPSTNPKAKQWYCFGENSIIGIERGKILTSKEAANALQTKTLYSFRKSRSGTGTWSTFTTLATEFPIYREVFINGSIVKTEPIPAHYEETIKEPYVIKDSYRRIEQSPWFVYCVCGSLTDAVDKAKIIAEKIGIENVRLEKNVPIGQFVKIR